ncbi:MAG: ABC transporter ATP-binding protein [Glycomyces artemisiae]|uniref:ABC transporter ATP-binding protein n=1 Tax=Glycomyces artemisiae TaxID=1076443 RepID=A0A2T0UVJ9_9ACTN|nr:ABC transporter ATP-binding protein [Glycomyces artemisiae]NUQ88078.1 ABC transporter ATP-binding protein [Glycomyces artemisiae]PRY61878.1 ABC-2 type transport system ATP-binding protein [Glycomyces artemisiae]
MDAAIEVADLRKTYRGRRTGEVRAVDGVSFRVERGEFFGILGPNGAGKTTTLEIVEGLRKPDSGDVRLLGRSPWPHSPELTRRLGVQLQASAFFEFLTVAEQIGTFAELYGAAKARAAEMLDLVGLAEHANMRCEKLSGGQQQRLSIACALVGDPELVFLDEPTAALDPQARRNLWDLMRAINDEGRTVVLTTHYMEEAEALCDRVAIMDAGRIKAVDSPAGFVRKLDAPTRVTVAAGQLDDARIAELALDGTASTADGTVVFETRDPRKLLTALASDGALEGLAVRTANLEDVFLHVTGREWRG